MFYLTEQGVEKIRTTTIERTKLKIDTVVFGDNAITKKDPTITEIGNEVYRKQFDSSDVFEKYNKQKDTLKISITIPANAGPFLVNEIGFYSDDELIIYGTIDTVEKLVGDNDLFVVEIEALIVFKNYDSSNIYLDLDDLSEIRKRLGILEDEVLDNKKLFERRL